MEYVYIGGNVIATKWNENAGNKYGRRSLTITTASWDKLPSLGCYAFRLTDYLPPIENANKASEKRRENGVCTLVLINPLDYKYSHDGLKATIFYLKTSDQKRRRAGNYKRRNRMNLKNFKYISISTRGGRSGSGRIFWIFGYFDIEV